MCVLSADDLRDRTCKVSTEACDGTSHVVDVVFIGKDFDTLILLSGPIKEQMLREHDREGGCCVTLPRQHADAHVRQAFTNLQYVFVELLGLHVRDRVNVESTTSRIPMLVFGHCPNLYSMVLLCDKRDVLFLFV